jgi:hypothetical protein
MKRQKWMIHRLLIKKKKKKLMKKQKLNKLNYQMNNNYKFISFKFVQKRNLNSMVAQTTLTIRVK